MIWSDIPDILTCDYMKFIDYSNQFIKGILGKNPNYNVIFILIC